MTSEGASPLLIPDITLNMGVSDSPFRVTPLPIPQPVQQPPWEMIPLPHVETSVLDHGSPLVLSPLPTRPLLTRSAGHYSRNPEPSKEVIIQTIPELELMSSAQKQCVITTKAAQNWGATEPLPGSACYPASLVLTSTLRKTLMPTTVCSVTKAGQWWPAPQGSSSMAQVSHFVLPSKGGPQNLLISGNIGVAPAQKKAPLEEACSSPSVYQNFRRWQSYKPLAQLYIPQTPDMEALACFFIPVLRSLARLRPTITLEEALGRAMWEWQHTNNYERMVFYDMAAKFMEFEAEEEMQAHKLQWKNKAQGLPDPTNTKPETQEALARPVGQQPASVPMNAGFQALEAYSKTQKVQQLPSTQEHFEDPPDPVQGYLDMMDELLKAPTQEAAGKEQEQEAAEPWSDPDLLSYLDELCSQEDFVTKVEAVIHPQFLAYLLSQDPQLDFSALEEKLEEVAGLTPSQLVEKRLLGPKDNGAKKTGPLHHVTFKKTRFPDSATGSGTPTPTQGDRPESSTAACTSKTDCGPELAETPVLGPETSALDQSPCPNLFLPAVSSKATFILGQAPPSGGMPGPKEQSNDADEELSSLAFLQTSQPSLLPWGLPLSPAPASGPHSPRGREGLGLCSPKKRGREGLRPRAPKRKAFQLPGPAAVPVKKHQVCMGPGSSPAKTPRLDETQKKCGSVSVFLNGPINPAERWLQPIVVLRRMKIPGIP